MDNRKPDRSSKTRRGPFMAVQPGSAGPTPPGLGTGPVSLKRLPGRNGLLLIRIANGSQPGGEFYASCWDNIAGWILPAVVSRPTRIGKLSLSNHPVAFNLSKSENRIAYVFTLEKDAGVDIEQILPLPDLSLLAKRTFSQQELAGPGRAASGITSGSFLSHLDPKGGLYKSKGIGSKATNEGFFGFG